MSISDNMPKKGSSLKTRTISGIILAPVVAGIIIWGGYAFLGLILVAGILALSEFFGLACKGENKWLHLSLGVVYIAVCIGSYIYLRLGFPQGAWLALSVIMCVWASDIGAYFTGKTFGGPKMAPRLSPNKTWAGLGGAMFFCGLSLAALLYGGQFIDFPVDTNLELTALHGFFVFAGGLFLGAVGQAGDLFISFYKRRVGAKDTGHLIPGHGGLLDRIDYLLLVSPAFLLVLLICL